jgi:hypothetical protein
MVYSERVDWFGWFNWLDWFVAPVECRFASSLREFNPDTIFRTYWAGGVKVYWDRFFYEKFMKRGFAALKRAKELAVII